MKRHEAAADKHQPEQESLGEKEPGVKDTEQPDDPTDEGTAREQSQHLADEEAASATVAPKNTQKRLAFKKAAFKKSIGAAKPYPNDNGDAPFDDDEADAIEVADARHNADVDAEADDEDEEIVVSGDDGDGDCNDEADEEKSGEGDNDGGDADGDEQEHSEDEDEELEEAGLTFDYLEDRARAADQLADELRVRICFDLI